MSKLKYDFANSPDLKVITGIYGAYLTVDELCECLKLKKTAAYKLVKDGEIRSSRTSTKKKADYRIPARAVADFMSKNEVRTA